MWLGYDAVGISVFDAVAELAELVELVELAELAELIVLAVLAVLSAGFVVGDEVGEVGTGVAGVDVVERLFG